MKLDIQTAISAIENVRQKIGAEDVKWSPNFEVKGFDPYGFIERLQKGEEITGIDIREIFEHYLCGDGSFGDKNGYQKFLVYLKDKTKEQIEKGQDPKFHIAHCETLQKYVGNRIYNKYTYTTRMDGVFDVNIISDNGYVKNEKMSLHVCKNCLKRLNWSGYADSGYKEKKVIFNNFTIEEFLEFYRNKHTGIIKPKYNSDIAPVHAYTKDWDAVSANCKKDRNYTCEQCGLYLKKDYKFLDCHHINACPEDNRPENLKVLCIACHSKQGGTGHADLKNKPRYKKFEKQYALWC